MAEHAFNPSPWEADGPEFEARLVYTVIVSSRTARVCRVPVSKINGCGDITKPGVGVGGPSVYVLLLLVNE